MSYGPRHTVLIVYPERDLKRRVGKRKFNIKEVDKGQISTVKR